MFWPTFHYFHYSLTTGCGEKNYTPQNGQDLKNFRSSPEKKLCPDCFGGKIFFCSKSYFLSFQVILEQKNFLTPQNFSKTQKFSKSPVLVNKVKILLNKVEILCYALFLEI